MKSSSELHELIHSLSMNEKRHFKLLSKRHEGKGGNSYVDLFETMLDQPEYDERALKSNLDKAGKLRFATEKNYLQNLVIDSLIHFHRNRPAIALYQKLISLDVLAEKKLFKTCMKVVRKGKLETLKLEKLFPALSFIRWEASLLSYTGGMADIDKVIEEERTVIALMNMQAQMMQLSFRIRNLLAKGKVQQSALNELVNSMKKVMKQSEREKTRTFLTIYYYHSALATAAAFYADHTGRKKNYALIHEYLEKHPWFILDIPHIYNSNINNIVSTCIALKRFDEAMDWIDVQRTYMDKYKLKNEAMSARIFLNTHEAEIQIYSRNRDYKKGIPLVKSVENGLRKFGEYYQGEQYDLILSLALLLFGGKELRGAARWINRIASVRTKVQPVPEVLVTSKLMLLIIHWQNEETNLGYQLKSTQRWLTKCGYFKSSDCIIRFLETMISPSSPREKKIQCITAWTTFRKLQEDPNEQLLSKYFDFEEWMRKTAELRSPNP